MFLEKMLGIYFGGLTFQSNNFNNLFTRHDRRRACFLFFCVGINLAGDFMMRKKKRKTVGPETPPAQKHCTGGGPASCRTLGLNFQILSTDTFDENDCLLLEGKTCQRETLSNRGVEPVFGAAVLEEQAFTVNLIEIMETVGGGCLQLRFMVSF